jgi:uncharacterized protein (TIGR00369 family)
LSEVHLEDGHGRLLAHGTSRLFLTRVDPARLTTPVATRTAEADAPSTPDPYLRPVEGTILEPHVWHGMSGLEFGQAVISGEIGLPPIGHLTGSRPVEVGEGCAEFTMIAHEWLCTPEGRIYGGATAMLVHDAMAAATHAVLPKGTAYATLDLTVSFVRPVSGDGREVRARGRVLHQGRTFAVAAGEVVNAENKTVCTATSSAMILSGRGFPGEDMVLQERAPRQA